MLKQQEEIMIQYQQLQQQLQTIMMQKEQYRIQLAEFEKASEDLKNTKSDEIFKVSGTILIKSSKKDVGKDLEEQKETLEVRMKTFDKQENLLRDKLMEVQKKLSSAQGK
ncbi:MAG: prefoldin subunit beta [Candidatus Aenigmarchaeota archaeon]|nr:prefoldin subunit beta [Candidatus Aenigmarchaeota archaeon]